MNLLDRIICEGDNGLRTISGTAQAGRPVPVPASLPAGLDSVAKSASPEQDRAESRRLMRVNHCGEVCAQALYQGQAFVAKAPATRAFLYQAANEERDHLAWCEIRLRDLGGGPSVLSGLFYAGSFGMGVASGLMGDKWSMGFLVETERQVEAHLGDHLNRLPAGDTASRSILASMREDEIRHGQAGQEQACGAKKLPKPVSVGMQAVSRLMTRTTYWV